MLLTSSLPPNPHRRSSYSSPPHSNERLSLRPGCLVELRLRSHSLPRVIASEPRQQSPIPSCSYSHLTSLRCAETFDIWRFLAELELSSVSVQTQIRMVVLFPQKHSIQGPPRPNEKEGDYKSDSTRSQRHHRGRSLVRPIRPVGRAGQLLVKTEGRRKTNDHHIFTPDTITLGFSASFIMASWIAS